MEDWKSQVEQLGRSARRASYQLAELSGEKKVRALSRVAEGLRGARAALIDANAADVAGAKEAGLAANLIERLKLDEKRVAAMADAVEQIAAQTDPVGQVIEGYVRPNGLRIQKVRVPLGVVLFIYESRPNVTSDAAALCIKSGNAIILRGGKEALNSNRAVAKVISDALAAAEIDPAAVQLVQSTDRALLPPLLKLDQYIDLVIPRGGESLIRAVVEQSSIPVLKHYTGNCHLYVDEHTRSMEKQVREICFNSKIGYKAGSTCNAVETLLFHRAAATELLPKVCADLAAKGVEVRGDDATRKLFPGAKVATEQDWYTEYLGPIVAVKVVESVVEAVEHINQYGSHHTDAVLTESLAVAEKFVKAVDSGSVIVNAATTMSDGGVYGLGAEIGISTDKLHARGPMGAADLTTYKWVVYGQGHVRQ